MEAVLKGSQCEKWQSAAVSLCQNYKSTKSSHKGWFESITISKKVLPLFFTGAKPFKSYIGTYEKKQKKSVQCPVSVVSFFVHTRKMTSCVTWACYKYLRVGLWAVYYLLQPDNRHVITVLHTEVLELKQLFSSGRWSWPIRGGLSLCLNMRKRALCLRDCLSVTVCGCCCVCVFVFSVTVYR